MPIAKPEQRIHFHSLPIGDSIADLGGKHGFGHFCFDGERYYVDGKRAVVGELHPHEIDGHEHAFVASFHNAHRTDVEVIKNVAERRMDAGFTAERSGSAVNAGEPQIWSNGDM